MGAMQRRKGKSFERELAIAFRRVHPEAKRTLTQQRDSGEAPDIDIPGYWVEAKFHKKVPIRKAYEQAVDEVRRRLERSLEANPSVRAPTHVPVAATKDNGKPTLVTMSLEHFLDILEELKAAREEALGNAQVESDAVVPKTT